MARRFTIGSPFTALYPMGRRFALWICTALALRVAAGSGGAAETRAQVQFHQDIQPILQEFCYDCHGDGANKGQVAFDELESKGTLLDPQLWSKVLKNVRAGLMPPQKKPRPSREQQEQIERWIKYTVFGIDPQNPDPGRVTVRRLNRSEYRNSIRDLMGIDYDSEVEFPPDDTGYGFDNIGDVLTLSPMLLEKYLAAARSVVSEAVPTVGRMVAEKRPKNYDRFFSRDAPENPTDRRAYAQEILGAFTTKAFRRPADDRTIERLTALAESVYTQPGKTFEAGIAHAMTAVLASPRFLFRLEAAEPLTEPQPGRANLLPGPTANIEKPVLPVTMRSASGVEPAPAGIANVDEFALASRLSYFLWSSMPD